MRRSRRHWRLLVAVVIFAAGLIGAELLRMNGNSIIGIWVACGAGALGMFYLLTWFEGSP